MAQTTRKVLIVEDHPLNLKLFRTILLAKGFETIEDRIGDKCLAYAELYQPSLIILDVLLPHLSGIDLARALKTKESTRHIPLLGVTSLTISETHTKMKEAGCLECLTKPFSLDVFLRAVDQALPPQAPERKKNNPFIDQAPSLEGASLLNQTIF